jgi:5S rRNA maturation endonuclease (ribonuclease M5)
VSTRLRERQEKIQQTIAQIAEESTRGALIVVEGQKDLDALRSFGVLGKMLLAKAGGKSFTMVLHEIEQAPPEQVILLLDFDRRGREATAKLKQGLERARIKPDLTFWRALHALVGREVQCIESLTSYLQTLEQKSTEV